MRNLAPGLHGPVPALSSSPAAENVVELQLGDYSRGVAKNVYDGEPSRALCT